MVQKVNKGAGNAGDGGEHGQVQSAGSSPSGRAKRTIAHIASPAPETPKFEEWLVKQGQLCISGSEALRKHRELCIDHLICPMCKDWICKESKPKMVKHQEKLIRDAYAQGKSDGRKEMLAGIKEEIK